MKPHTYCLCLWLFLCPAFSQVSLAQADSSVFGEWVPPAGDAVIEISQHGENVTLVLQGTLEANLKDEQNKDRELRDRLLEGIVLGEGFQFDDDWWRDATLYDPDTGKTYNARFQLQDPNHLILRGYIGVSALGRSMVLTRKSLFQEQMLRLLNIDIPIREKNCSEGGDHE